MSRRAWCRGWSGLWTQAMIVFVTIVMTEFMMIFECMWSVEENERIYFYLSMCMRAFSAFRRGVAVPSHFCGPFLAYFRWNLAGVATALVFRLSSFDSFACCSLSQTTSSTPPTSSNLFISSLHHHSQWTGRWGLVLNQTDTTSHTNPSLADPALSTTKDPRPFLQASSPLLNLRYPNHRSFNHNHLSSSGRETPSSFHNRSIIVLTLIGLLHMPPSDLLLLQITPHRSVNPPSDSLRTKYNHRHRLLAHPSPMLHPTTLPPIVIPIPLEFHPLSVELAPLVTRLASYPPHQKNH